MIAMQEPARCMAPQRYTISQLLQIARDAKYPFDLSKFTYDAARGVVPPLGEIAVASRRSSSQRIRGWSSESIDAGSERLSNSGNAALQPPTVEPRRQPSNPPVDEKVQKDAGFAKFLKKHSSPTHNRVTTGGRIVPMEKRDSPPKFDLQQSHISKEVLQNGLKDSYNSSDSLLNSPTATHAKALGHLDSSVDISPTKQEAIEDVIAHGPAVQDSNAMLSTAMPSVGFPFQRYGLPYMGHYTVPYPYFWHPGSGFGGAQGYAAAGGWQQLAATNAVPAAPRDKFEGVEPTTQLLVTAQSCLSQAQSQYELLDRQLKSMDRHRAMSSHDPTLATQRMAVVQQRADLKAMINRLSLQVEMLQNTSTMGMGSPSKFVPSAQPFIPRSAPQEATASPRPRSTSGSIELTAEAERNFDERSPAPVPRSRKIIPIIPPPSKGTGTKQQLHPSSQSAETQSMWNIDQYGVRYRASSDKSAYTMEQPLEPIKANIVVKTSIEPTSAARKISAKSTAAPEVIGWHEGRPGPLLEELFELTDVYYDALRLPVGVITIFTLPNGDTFEVCGAALQPAEDLSAMSVIERSYWEKKPDFTKSVLTGLRCRAKIVDADKYTDDYLLGIGKDLDRSALNVRDLLQEAMSVETDRRRQLAASVPMTVPLRVIPENETSIMEDLSNKGYSATSVQSIHATVRLPPSFDGTTDNSRRDARTILTTTNKNRSPRVLRRSAPGGGA